MKKEAQYYLANINELIPYVNNARTHSDTQIAQIAASIKEFGFLNPVIVSSDNTILCGHGRYYAAQKLGLEKIPCIKEEHLTEVQKKAYIIADNKLALNAGWDNDLLTIELSDLQGVDFDLDLLGFDDKELSKLFDETKDIEDDDFDVEEELKKPAITQTGDIWHLGKHTLICGDSTKEETYKKLLGDTKVNLVVTDPPYNVNYEGSAGKIKNDDMEDSAFYHFLLDAFKQTEKVMAQDSSIYVFHADTEGYNFRKAFKDAGFYLSGTCIWKKQSLVLGRSPYQWQHEPILFGWKQKGKHQWYTGRKESTIWEFDKPKKNTDHPTMKPLDLIAYPIKNSSMTNSVVLDMFGGSGSTLLASDQLDRICYTIELDEKFCDVIVKRYIEQVGNSSDVYVIRDGKKLGFEKVGGTHVDNG
ncbi:site-specific DNA-methyltransferase [Streptococcus porci]|uniref:site-specific DNA-methyltransferase n=1 Tax=Streptococcus porci TaxID=502567 RepID=UPI000427F424|nr:site-specific DNA-methyltransferase [Streptococcus porci]QBX27887.1 adenine-specific methyltransferase [Streptococcus phage Javan422]HEL9645055.1 site-specific DNA-methyltransferase [Streptococcus suis]HEL9645880.1 site-specific DNA-methyltransferase [Streptococcus suis]